MLVVSISGVRPLFIASVSAVGLLIRASNELKNLLRNDFRTSNKKILPQVMKNNLVGGFDETGVNRPGAIFLGDI